MKKIILTLAALVVILTAKGQDYKFGIKSSFTFNKVFSEQFATTMGYAEKTSIRFGTQSGIYGAYVIAERLHLQAELLYGYQGYKIRGDYEHLAMTLNYINLPIMAKYYLVDGFSVEAGPQLGFCFGGNYTYNCAGRDFNVTLPSDSYNKIDISLVAGATYDMEYLSLWIRYAIGFIPVFKTTDAANHYFFPENAKNSVFSIGLAYRFLR